MSPRLLLLLFVSCSRLTHTLCVNRVHHLQVVLEDLLGLEEFLAHLALVLGGRVHVLLVYLQAAVVLQQRRALDALDELGVGAEALVVLLVPQQVLAEVVLVVGAVHAQLALDVALAVLVLGGEVLPQQLLVLEAQAAVLAGVGHGLEGCCRCRCLCHRRRCLRGREIGPRTVGAGLRQVEHVLLVVYLDVALEVGADLEDGQADGALELALRIPLHLVRHRALLDDLEALVVVQLLQLAHLLDLRHLRQDQVVHHLLGLVLHLLDHHAELVGGGRNDVLVAAEGRGRRPPDHVLRDVVVQRNRLALDVTELVRVVLQLDLEVRGRDVVQVCVREDVVGLGLHGRAGFGFLFFVVVFVFLFPFLCLKLVGKKLI
jgi:hypothetical protein